MQIALIFAVLPSHSKQETDQTKLNILAFAIASKAVKEILKNKFVTSLKMREK